MPINGTALSASLSHQRFCLPISRRPLCPAPSDAFVPSSRENPASNQQPWDTNTQAVHETLQVKWLTAVYWDIRGEEARRIGDKGDLCLCYCYDLLNTYTHSSTIIFYANGMWLRRQRGILLRPKAEILHHHPYSLYIWSLVNQSCVPWDSGLCYCLAGVMFTQMQLERVRPANEKWDKQSNDNNSSPSAVAF